MRRNSATGVSALWLKSKLGALSLGIFDDNMAATSQVQDMLDRMGTVLDLIEQSWKPRLQGSAEANSVCKLMIDIY